MYILIHSSPQDRESRDAQNNIIGGIELFSEISNTQVNQLKVRELEKLAFLDKLTQISNRNYLDNELKTRLAEWETLQIPFGILFIDIDHFKQFNDTYGHDVGSFETMVETV
ncbi:MAG: GGDEF domain-containing protein [Microcystaceae cyanobacterium]